MLIRDSDSDSDVERLYERLRTPSSLFERLNLLHNHVGIPYLFRSNILEI